MMDKNTFILSLELPRRRDGEADEHYRYRIAEFILTRDRSTFQRIKLQLQRIKSSVESSFFPDFGISYIIDQTISMIDDHQ